MRFVKVAMVARAGKQVEWALRSNSSVASQGKEKDRREERGQREV